MEMASDMTIYFIVVKVIKSREKTIAGNRITSNGFGTIFRRAGRENTADKLGNRCTYLYSEVTFLTNLRKIYPQTGHYEKRHTAQVANPFLEI